MNGLEDDLMTIIDFCDAMMRYYDEWYGDDVCFDAIREAHDIAHVITGGDRVTTWDSVRWALNRPKDEYEGFGPAWPDVRLRMTDAVKRAEEMTE